jgi:chemotaxis methyl-accepting protein methylase
MCRNLVFTYFEKQLQQEILEMIVDKLQPNGFIVIGSHETLPKKIEALSNYKNIEGIYQKVP